MPILCSFHSEGKWNKPSKVDQNIAISHFRCRTFDKAIFSRLLLLLRFLYVIHSLSVCILWSLFNTYTFPFVSVPPFLRKISLFTVQTEQFIHCDIENNRLNNLRIMWLIEIHFRLHFVHVNEIEWIPECGGHEHDTQKFPLIEFDSIDEPPKRFFPVFFSFFFIPFFHY